VSTSVAALWGGTTTIMDFGIPRDHSETPLDAAINKMALAERSRCDVGLHGSVINWDPSVPRQLEQLATLGIRSVKLYMTNRGTTIADNDTVLKVMHEMVRLDGLVYIHAEHDAIIVDSTRTHADHGRISIEDLHQTRPALAEEASVREVIAMAQYTGAPVYFVHQSTAVAVDLVVDARRAGLNIHSEACPHYLLIDDSCYRGAKSAWYACCPPMRPKSTVTALRQRFVDGAFDTISSDHSCYTLAQKQEHRTDTRLMPHGLPGVETRMPASFTALMPPSGTGEDSVKSNLLQRFVDVFSAGPARINGLTGKGKIAPGYDADLVIFDPHEVRTVDAAALHMGTDFSPFHGRSLQGWPQVVVSAGRVVLDEGELKDPGPRGRFLSRAGYHEP